MNTRKSYSRSSTKTNHDHQNTSQKHSRSHEEDKKHFFDRTATRNHKK